MRNACQVAGKEDKKKQTEAYDAGKPGLPAGEKAAGQYNE